jgi:hypothetical protein
MAAVQQHIGQDQLPKGRQRCPKHTGRVWLNYCWPKGWQLVYRSLYAIVQDVVMAVSYERLLTK